MKWYLLTRIWQAGEGCDTFFALIELDHSLIAFIEKAKKRHEEIREEVESLFQMTYSYIGYPCFIEYGDTDELFEELIAKADIRCEYDGDWALVNAKDIESVNLDDNVRIDVTQLVVDNRDFYWKTYYKNTDVQVMTRHIPFDRLSEIRKAMSIGFSKEELPYLQDRLHTLVSDECDKIIVRYSSGLQVEVKNADDIELLIIPQLSILEVQAGYTDEEGVEHTNYIRPNNVEVIIEKATKT